MPQVSPIIAWVVLFATMGSAVAMAQAPQRNSPGPGIVRLAERGDARAQTRLGFMLATGRGVPKILSRRPIGINVLPTKVIPMRNTCWACVTTWGTGFRGIGCWPTSG